MTSGSCLHSYPQEVSVAYLESCYAGFVKVGQDTCEKRQWAETGIVKFVLLHNVKNDDGIRLFFIDLWEAYIKVKRYMSWRGGLLISNVDITKSILYRQHADKESSV